LFGYARVTLMQHAVSRGEPTILRHKAASARTWSMNQNPEDTFVTGMHTDDPRNDPPTTGHAPEIRLADEDLSAVPALDTAFRQAIGGTTVRVEIGGRTLYLTDRPPLDHTVEPHELDAAFADAADEILDPSLMNFKHTRDVTEMMNALRREDPEAG
jgi:hypothetical protein